jgi:phosphoglycerate dehydrogenase-like enzyme
MKTADVLIGWRFPHDNLKQRAPRLKLIHSTGAGIEHLTPFDWLPRDVVLTNNRGVHAPKAGEFAAMAILMLNNYMPDFIDAQRRREWRRFFASTAAGKTLLVVGVGQMGGAAARAAKRLGLRVLGVRRTRQPHRAVDAMYGPEDLPMLLPQADFVMVTAPLTDATRHMIGRRELDLMHKDAGLINMGRAGVVDYDALSEKLRRNELRGAVLDVFSPEPLPADSPLWSVPKLVITPHCSSDDVDRYAIRTLELVFDNIARLLAGRPLRNRVRRSLGY